MLLQTVSPVHRSSSRATFNQRAARELVPAQSARRSASSVPPLLAIRDRVTTRAHADADIQAELQKGPVPKLVVFDLDATMWLPEMFQLQAVPDEILPDGGLRAGEQVVRMFPGALAALRELRNDPRFAETKIAVASASEQPFFADACLTLFEVEPGVCFGSMVSFKEIYPISNKAFHFNKIKKMSGIEFTEMLFFDDNIWGDKTGEVMRQCQGVVAMTVPDGLTVQKWNAGLLAFARAAKARASSGK